MKSLNHLTKLLTVFIAVLLSSLSTASATSLSSGAYDYTVGSSVSSFDPQAKLHRSTVTPRGQKQFSKNNNGELRSKSDVMREVKKRYNAEILRISLSKNGRTYVVRMLMPNGKVRSVQVNALR